MRQAERPQRWWSKRAPDEGPWDVIVIGSGMGGMTAAAMLSQLGNKVLVLEQHYVPGGFTHTFRRQGYTWDVGVHAVGEVTSHSLTGRLLHRLSQGRLQWASLGSAYEHFYYPDDIQVDFPDHPKLFRENLLGAFPGGEATIDGYLDRVKEVALGMRGYYMSRSMPRWAERVGGWWMGRQVKPWLSRTIAEVMDELPGDPRLKAALIGQWGYHGAVPSRGSFAVQALVCRHFAYGGYYPVGGSGRIAQELLRTVAEGGGWTRIVADVESVVVEGRRAVGVRLRDGELLRAPRIVSAAGVVSTATRLLPEALQSEEWIQGVRDLRPAPAHVCLNIGLKGDVAAAGGTPGNQWYFTTWDHEVGHWHVRHDQALTPSPVLYCSFPSLKDPEHDPGPEQRHTAEVVTFVPWESFAPWKDSGWRKRGPDYETFKAKLQDMLLQQFLGHRPELAPLVDHVELSTPLSTDYFCRPMRGSIYGMEPTPERFANPWLRPHSPLPGLYFAGSEISSVGVVGAMMGGVMATLAMEPRAGMRMLRGL